MKQYTGTKTLMARPMTLGEYNTLRGWNMPPNEDQSAPGYLVEYQDGDKPNHPDFKGYISWSPRDVFEKTYWPSDSHEHRVLAELKELEDRIVKLGRFMETGAFRALDDRPRLLLRRQLNLMTQLSEVISDRTEMF